MFLADICLAALHGGTVPRRRQQRGNESQVTLVKNEGISQMLAAARHQEGEIRD